MIVVKVGGSLFDLPDLGSRLRCWLEQWPEEAVVLVPGGGSLAEAVRDLYRRHALGEEVSHWLALAAMSLTGRFLAALLPDAEVSANPNCASASCRIILDAFAFARADEGRSEALPHSWRVTSDSVAARVAATSGARRLVLLKSVDIPKELGWAEAGRRGLVDEHFALALPPGIEVTAVNFRTGHA